MRNKIRKILSVVMVLLLLSTVVSYAVDSKVEILFSVGDETLIINGEPVKVEKPYVVGEGVTLVPLRVITEAFGAQVGWIAESKTITLDYPDVNIVLQIGNSVAEVNGKAETLLSAPELTSSGFTMVPLRFISETFGAVVSYNEETKSISVVKGDSEEGNTVEGGITEKKIGDSYFGWSMENPTDMQMTKRNFDGTQTYFQYDDEHGFYVNVSLKDTAFDFGQHFTSIKSTLSKFTLVKADKDESKGTIHIQSKDKQDFLNLQIYVLDNYIIELSGVFSNDDVEKRDEFIRIMSTFETKYENTDTYDLSNCKDGLREFKDENLKLSISVPEDFYLASSENSENSFVFYRFDVNDTRSRISIDVFSKSSVTGAAEMAKKDLERNKKTVNSSLVTYSGDVTQKTYSDISCYEYAYEIKGSFSNDSVSRDVFFEKGEYVYNVNISFKENVADENFDKILNSIKAEEIDTSKVGTFLRNLGEDEGKYTSETSAWSIEVPNTYKQISATAESGSFIDTVTGFMFTVQVVNAPRAYHADVKTTMKNILNQYVEQEKAKILIPLKDTTINGTKYADSTMTIDENEVRMYIRQMACVERGKMLVFSFTTGELGYSDLAQAEFIEIIKSLKLKF